MKNLKIEVCLSQLPICAVSLKDGRKTFDLQAFDGLLTVAVQYDYDRQSLRLNAEIKLGDRIKVILLKHRIELYVNEVLMDEEWPAGERLLDLGDAFIGNADVACCEYAETPRCLPEVIDCFENAEGWYPGNGVFVGDCMPYRRGDEYHVLYLKDRHNHRSKWGLGAHQWEHISTRDFLSWRIHPTAVPITDPTEGSICTGSWITNGGKEYLYYTVRRGRGIPAPIRRSVSADGYHFEKDDQFDFTISERYHAASARDPKIVKGHDGLFHMFLTTSLMPENKGCLAHFVSRDLECWEDVGKPIYVSDTHDQPECPDYFEYNGKYYLVFSLCARAHYAISDQPFEGFAEPSDPIIPCESVPKGAIFDDRIVFAGFKSLGGYAGSMTFKAARAAENGTLIFEAL